MDLLSGIAFALVLVLILWSQKHDKKKRGRKPKSSFYHIRWNHVGINDEKTAELLGVSVDDVRRWDDEGAPVMAEKLLLLWDRKHIGYEGWNGFMFSRGVLIYKKQRWTARGLLEIHEQNRLINRLENEIARLNTIKGATKVLYTIFVNKLVSKRLKRQLIQCLS